MPKVVVYHRGHGCDTGCCGHAIKVDGKEQGFHFAHPETYEEDERTFAKRLVTEELGPEHVADLDWENCLILDDFRLGDSWYDWCLKPHCGRH